MVCAGAYTQPARRRASDRFGSRFCAVLLLYTLTDSPTNYPFPQRKRGRFPREEVVSRLLFDPWTRAHPLRRRKLQKPPFIGL